MCAGLAAGKMLAGWKRLSLTQGNRRHSNSQARSGSNGRPRDDRSKGLWTRMLASSGGYGIWFVTIILRVADVRILAVLVGGGGGRDGLDGSVIDCDCCACCLRAAEA